MDALFDRLAHIFEESHGARPPGLRNDAAFTQREDFRPAAVLIGVTDRPDPGLLLTHRPLTLRQHAGQIAFPGGKLDPGEDAITAALRETHEELGISPEDIAIVGATDRFLTGTGYDITPVLGLMRPDLPITPNPQEVSSWFEAPLRYVLDPANQVRKQATFGGILRDYTEISWEGHRIWGVTAAIIENLSNRIAWRGLLDD